MSVIGYLLSVNQKNGHQKQYDLNSYGEQHKNPRTVLRKQAAGQAEQKCGLGFNPSMSSTLEDNSQGDQYSLKATVRVNSLYNIPKLYNIP